jgi:hypothetical protein
VAVECVQFPDGPGRVDIAPAQRAGTIARVPREPSHYHVYVVELSRAAWDVPRFRRANPDYIGDKPLVYVGMTGLDPDIRFDRHKAGVQANRFAKDYGLRLLPQLFEHLNPMPHETAVRLEVELAIALRLQGYGVWQA